MLRIINRIRFINLIQNFHILKLLPFIRIILLIIWCHLIYEYKIHNIGKKNHYLKYYTKWSINLSPTIYISVKCKQYRIITITILGILIVVNEYKVNDKNIIVIGSVNTKKNPKYIFEWYHHFYTFWYLFTALLNSSFCW